MLLTTMRIKDTAVTIFTPPLTDADAGDSRHATSRPPPPMMMYLLMSTIIALYLVRCLLGWGGRTQKGPPVYFVLEALRLKIEEVQSRWVICCYVSLRTIPMGNLNVTLTFNMDAYV